MMIYDGLCESGFQITKPCSHDYLISLETCQRARVINNAKCI